MCAMTQEFFCYRVWMKDGYASLHTARTENEARVMAIAMSKRNIEGVAMDASEKREAVTVDYAECLDK